MMTMLILPRREINDDVSVEGSRGSRVKGRAASKRSRPPCAGDRKSVKDDDLADVFCKHMMMLILPRWEIKNDVSGEG